MRRAVAGRLRREQSRFQLRRLGGQHDDASVKMA